MKNYNANVLIVGAGPAGMATALELSKMGIDDIIIIDRDNRAGGLPYLSHHLGFGMRDIHKVLSGPAYCKYYINEINKTQIQLITEVTITSWESKNTVTITTPLGLGTIKAKAVLLATGCRERPRSSLLVPGSRPKGIFNTGSLQDIVHGYNNKVGKRAVIIGAELVSYSAIHTLKKAGCLPILMTTEFENHQIPNLYLPFKWLSSNFLNKVPLEKNVKVSNIFGKARVEAIELTNINSGTKKEIACDTIIFTGNWIPDNELARLGSVKINKNTNGPVVDANLRTSKIGVFAAGNLLRGAETSDIAALEGRHVAKSIFNYLKTETWFQDRADIIVEKPIKWIFPNSIETNSHNIPMNRFLFRVTDFLKNQSLVVRQDEKILFQKSYKSLQPNYSIKLSGEWLNKLSSKLPINITLE